MNHKTPALFVAIAKTAQVRIDNFKPQELSNTAWAFATLNHDAPSLFDVIARTAQERIDEFIPQELANSAWEFAVLNVNAKSALSLTDPDSPFLQTLLSLGPSSLKIPELRQLHQYQLWCRERSTST